MYRMVVTDLDGTLLNSQKQVSDANAKAIYKLKDQNITFVMATGRSDVMTKAYTKQLKNADIVIGCDGAVIRNIRTGEILYENHLSSETCHKTFEICKKYGLQYYVFAKDELVSDDPQNERFLIHQKFNQTVEEDEEIPMRIVDDLNEYVKEHIIYKIVVSHNDKNYLDKVAVLIITSCNLVCCLFHDIICIFHCNPKSNQRKHLNIIHFIAKCDDIFDPNA